MLNQYEHAWISVISSSVPSNSESSPRCPIHLKPIQEMVSWRTRHLLPLAAAARALVQSQLPTFATRSDSFRPFPVSHIFTFTAFNIHMVCSDIQSMGDWYFDWHSAAQPSFCILLHSIKSVGRAWKSMFTFIIISDCFQVGTCYRMKHPPSKSLKVSMHVNMSEC